MVRLFSFSLEAFFLFLQAFAILFFLEEFLIFLSGKNICLSGLISLSLRLAWHHGGPPSSERSVWKPKIQLHTRGRGVVEVGVRLCCRLVSRLGLGFRFRLKT